MSDGVTLIAEERRRQVEQEGFTAGNDANYTEGDLALVAALYATPIPLYRVSIDDDRQNQATSHRGVTIELDDPWPVEWGAQWDKRTKHPRVRQLIIAGALIAAEIDRLLQEETREIPSCAFLGAAAR